MPSLIEVGLSQITTWLVLFDYYGYQISRTKLFYFTLQKTIYPTDKEICPTNDYFTLDKMKCLEYLACMGKTIF